MKILKFLSIFFCMVLMTACSSSKIHRVLEQGETDFETGNETTELFHSVLYHPSEISLNFPGYIVGIEKSPKENVSNPKLDIKRQKMNGYGDGMDEHVQRIGKDDKLLFISHIVKNFGKQHGLGNCTQYNAYFRPGMNPSSIKPCKDAAQKQIKAKTAFKSSWTALEILKQDIQREIQHRATTSQPPFTHILVMTMGWNTEQEEAVRNFNSIVKNIKLASGKESFNPLFIGVTWPSKWEAAWFTPLVTLFSYGNKADDADEVGFSWLGVLVHDTLKEVSADIPLVVLGHSFGARATSMGVCVGPGIKKGNQDITRNKDIALLVSLQGAYSANRFFEKEGKEEIYYRKGCNQAKYVAVTSSKYDEALDKKRWVPFVGNDVTYTEYCEEKKPKELDCVQASKSGKVLIPQNSENTLLYINADELVYYNAFKSGGNAHSDIYRTEMGEMLWTIIKAKGSTKN